MIAKITNRAGVDIILVGIRVLRYTSETPNHFETKQPDIRTEPGKPFARSVNIKIYYMFDDSNNAVYCKSFIKYILLRTSTT